MTKITVAIPTFNRAEQLRACLETLDEQTAAREDFEVLVVDDGSSDDTPRLLAELEPSFTLRTVRQENHGQPRALNRAIEEAAGQYCLFLDDDILADPHLVQGHLDAQTQTGGVIGLGALRLRIEGIKGGLARYFANWWEEHYSDLASGAVEPDFWAGFSGNFSAPTAALREIGGFAEDLKREFDVDLTYRLERTGLPLKFLPDAAGEQVFTKGFREILADYEKAGEATVTMWRRHPELLRHAPLGDFDYGGRIGVLTRRILLALGAPTWPFALIDRLLERKPAHRIYIHLQLLYFWRGLKRALDDRDTFRRLVRAPVILMYHAIAGPDEKASRFILPVGRFRWQMRWLRWTRRPILTLDEYVRLREENRLAPAGAVIVTFDDGYSDNSELAAPILDRLGIPATFFVVTDTIGRENTWDDVALVAKRPMMSWQDIERLHEAGHAIGAHTLTHPRLSRLDPGRAREEIAASRDVLQRRLGVPIRHFSYPFGDQSEAVRNAVAELGFASACGVEPGTNGHAVPILNLRRVEVWGTRTLPRFALDLWLGRHLGAPRAKAE